MYKNVFTSFLLLFWNNSVIPYTHSLTLTLNLTLTLIPNPNPNPNPYPNPNPKSVWCVGYTIPELCHFFFFFFFVEQCVFIKYANYFPHTHDVNFLLWK